MTQQPAAVKIECEQIQVMTARGRERKRRVANEFERGKIKPHGDHSPCGRAVGFHAATRRAVDESAAQAAKAGSRLCSDCGGGQIAQSLHNWAESLCRI